MDGTEGGSLQPPSVMRHQRCNSVKMGPGNMEEHEHRLSPIEVFNNIRGMEIIPHATLTALSTKVDADRLVPSIMGFMEGM